MKVTKEMGVNLPSTTITRYDPVALDVLKAPFSLHGFHEPFIRVPADVAKNTSERVELLGRVNTGGRVRFRTDSDFIAIHAVFGYGGYLDKLSDASFDMNFYKDGKFTYGGLFLPSAEGAAEGYHESRVMCSGEMKDVIINFPISSQVTEMYVILREGCEICEATPYKHETPIVFYGSSIVHGACASRPGMNYPSIVSRLLDSDIRNIGFGGAAHAEPAIIDYIKSLPMSVFVYDYDHNAPNHEELAKTHYEGYKRFREARPDIPVIFASRPDFYPYVEQSYLRREVVKATYQRALEEGDKLVSFIDGETFYPDDLRHEMTADNCHPNDAGYIEMAKKFSEEIKKYI